MIKNLPTYQNYKDSGSPFLGKVPGHWDVRNLRTLISPTAERGRPDLPLLSVAREKGVFIRSLTGDDNNHNVIPDDLTNYKVARKGTLVINKMKAWQGSMGISPCDGIVSPAYYVFKFRIDNLKFGQALLRSKPYVCHFGQFSDGVRVGQWDLSLVGMKEIPILLPPNDEQDSIVKFLNWINTKIDLTIKAKKRTISLLQEQKQSIINNVVTKGINPSIKMKFSGLEWLGDIPEHWKIVRNQSLFAHKVEKGIQGLPVLQVSLHSGITPEELDQFGRPKKYISDHTKYKLVRKNDLAYNTMRMWQGAIGVSPSDGLVSPAYVVLSPRKNVVPHFYQHLFKTDFYKQQVNRYSTGIVSDRNRLYWENFKQMLNISLPPEEQVEIVEHINKRCLSLDKGIAHFEKEIELIRDFKARITSDVVTGKIDVRIIVQNLPDSYIANEPETETQVDTEIMEDELNAN